MNVPDLTDVARSTDAAARWLTSWLSHIYRPAVNLVVLPALLLVAYVLLRWLVGGLLPWALRWLLGPATVALIGIAGYVTLAAEFLASQGFRLFRLRPPLVLYGLGDLAVGATIRLQRSARLASLAAHRVRNTPRLLLLAVAGTAIVWWSRGYCGRAGSGGACQSPVSVWTDAVSQLWPFS